MISFHKSLGAVLLCLLLGICGALADVRTVVIDAGHGGHDRGASSLQRIPEKDAALDVARRLERELRAQGLRTVMTRKGDYFVSLGRRAAKANRYRNAIFVSVHFNAARRRSARGYETFFYHRASYPLARAVQSDLMRASRTINRGVKRRGFYVIRRTRMPAILVECGFLTNPREARLARSSRHRQRLAECIARGILRYAGKRPSRVQDLYVSREKEAAKKIHVASRSESRVHQGRTVERESAPRKVEQRSASYVRRNRNARFERPSEALFN